MAKNSKKMLIALITIVLCICMIVGGTYALFSDKITLTNHLQAGTLNITLKRTSLTTTLLDDETGYLKTVIDDEELDFTEETSENVFGLAEETKIVPQCSFAATMKISNNSDVAFSYSIQIKLDGETNALAEQLKVTVSREGSEDQTATVKDDLIIENIETLTKNASDTFIVKVEFIDDDSINDLAQDKTVKFDLIVSAVQVTEAPQA